MPILLLFFSMHHSVKSYKFKISKSFFKTKIEFKKEKENDFMHEEFQNTDFCYTLVFICYLKVKKNLLMYCTIAKEMKACIFLLKNRVRLRVKSHHYPVLRSRFVLCFLSFFEFILLRSLRVFFIHFSLRINKPRQVEF